MCNYEPCSKVCMKQKQTKVNDDNEEEDEDGYGGGGDDDDNRILNV